MHTKVTYVPETPHEPLDSIEHLVLMEAQGEMEEEDMWEDIENVLEAKAGVEEECMDSLEDSIMEISC